LGVHNPIFFYPGEHYGIQVVHHASGAGAGERISTTKAGVPM